MQRRHDDELTARLEQIVDVGYTRILWCELYRWYEASRLAVGTYRDIVSRYQEIAREYRKANPDQKVKPNMTLQRIELADGLLLFTQGYVKDFLKED